MLPVLVLLALNRIAPEAPAGPFRQPQLASAHGRVAMAFGGPGAIWFASSSDQGKTFAKPVKVADLPALALGRHRGPRLAILESALVITAIAFERKTGDDGNLIAWRSTDDGRTWKRAATINDVPRAAREGLHDLAAGPDGTLFTAWLDLRQTGTRLYGARSTDGGLTWSKNVAIYLSPGGTICQCCHPSVRFDSEGNVWAMWRNALDGSRDLYAARSRDGLRFDPAVKLGAGTWKLEACPMDGGGFFVAHGKVTSAWRRETDVYLAEPGSPERRIGAGKDVALARGQRGTYVAWSRATGGIEVLSPGDGLPVVLSNEGGFVSLAALSDGGVLAAWEAHDSIEIARLD